MVIFIQPAVQNWRVKQLKKILKNYLKLVEFLNFGHIKLAHSAYGSHIPWAVKLLLQPGFSKSSSWLYSFN